MHHSLASATLIPPTAPGDRILRREPRIEPARLDADEGRSRALIQSSVDPIIVADGRTNVVLWNNAAEAVFGYTGDQMLGRPLTLLLPDEPDDPVGWIRQAMRAETRTLGKALALTGRRQDGTEFPVELSISMWTERGETFLGGILRDVSDREATQEKLRHAERQYRDLFEEAPLMYVVTRSEDGKSVIEDCNNIFLASLGYARHEIVGREMREFTTPSSPGPGEPWGGVRDQERQLLRKNGGVLQTLQRTVLLYDAHGRIRGERAMYMDISQLRRAVQKIDSLQTQLRQSQTSEAIGRLAGGIAHDFNNILTAILGYSESIVRESNPHDRLHEDALEIQRAAEKAAALTQQLLALSKRQALKMTTVDLNDVVRDVHQLISRLIGEHITIEARLAPDLEAVTADRSQLEQILINLAVNARDAMPAGGRLAIITSTADRDQTDMGQYTIPAGRYTTLAVTDTGTGMDAHTQTQIFEPFFTTKGPGEGSGLGLATVYGTVKQLGGFLEVTSALGRGTTFVISLPATDQPLAPVARTETTCAEPGRGETILLVEDDAAVRAYAAQVLRRADYDVIEAPTPDAALRIADRGGMIHGVLTDVIMPGMNGKQMVTRLQETRPELKVLYMSGYSGTTYFDSSIVDPARERLVEKPFTRDTLLRTLREVLESADHEERPDGSGRS